MDDRTGETAPGEDAPNGPLETSATGDVPAKRRRLSKRSISAWVGAKSNSPSCPLTPAVPICLGDEWLNEATRTRLRSEFAGAVPYSYVVLRPFLGEAALRVLRSELQCVDAQEKETDLFRFFQTADLAPPRQRPKQIAKVGKKRRLQAERASAALGAKAPTVAALAQLFGAPEFRQLCSDITDGEALSDRVDLAAQVYPRRGHLLCHDDVIGTRKVSFIYYMTDPEGDWQPEEGGALELYPQQPGAPRGTPSPVPSKELLPLSDSLVLFVVEPGASFHAVRELRGGRARISMQGWLHAPSVEATASAGDRHLATLQQVLRATATQPLTLEATSLATSDAQKDAAQVEELSDADLKLLSRWIAPEYLCRQQLEQVSQRFADSSYAVLTHFLRADVAARCGDLRAKVDLQDGFRLDAPEPPVPPYSAGAEGGWKLLGPPHLQRYLSFEGASEDSVNYIGASSASSSSVPPSYGELGSSLREIAEELFRRPEFRRFLRACTRLESRDAGTIEIRRFRPGLDYTVATHLAAPQRGQAALDATLAFVGDDKAEFQELWSSEDVGGFESYLAMDDEEETAEAQEVYRGEDMGALVNLPALSNALCLVMRDSKTLRFLKYLSRDAPSSRVDISAVFRVDEPDSEESGSDEAKM